MFKKLTKISEVFFFNSIHQIPQTLNLRSKRHLKFSIEAHGAVIFAVGGNLCVGDFEFGQGGFDAFL